MEMFILILGIIIGVKVSENYQTIDISKYNKAAEVCKSINSDLERVYVDGDLVCKNGIEVNVENSKLNEKK